MAINQSTCVVGHVQVAMYDLLDKTTGWYTIAELVCHFMEAALFVLVGISGSFEYKLLFFRVQWW